MRAAASAWARDWRERWFNPPRKACKAAADAPVLPQPWGNGTPERTWLLKLGVALSSQGLISHESPETYTWDSDSKRKLVRAAVRHPPESQRRSDLVPVRRGTEADSSKESFVKASP